MFFKSDNNNIIDTEGTKFIFESLDNLVNLTALELNLRYYKIIILINLVF